MKLTTDFPLDVNLSYLGILAWSDHGMVLLVSPALVHSLLVIKRDAGNGKTISIKASMKSCDEKGFRPLYVKSFQSKFIPPLF